MSRVGFPSTTARIRSQREMADFSASARAAGRTVVYTNGCFDILHAGHVTYLEQARSPGDALIVALNSDISVRAVKGPDRPIQPEAARAALLAALACVDCVTLFDETHCADVIRLAKPNVYVKGGDYTIATLNRTERQALKACGVEIAIVPLVQGYSTTDIVAHIVAHQRRAARPDRGAGLHRIPPQTRPPEPVQPRCMACRH
jgi:rfaE bifunctional protein nucleotidyltransferase chain/domain